MSRQPLLVVGASARAACYSAARAGYSPHWMDLFGDHDLAGRYPGKRVPSGDYPATMLDMADAFPDAPFLYTGAMENHPQTLGALELKRKLLGNGVDTCRGVRDPVRLAACFSRAGVSHPAVPAFVEGKADDAKVWLIKPLRSAGGRGIRLMQKNESRAGKDEYLQEYIEGEARSGVFLANGSRARLLGVTRQLVGEAFLQAGPFSYCGSIGPVNIDEHEREQWLAAAGALAETFGLRGLFGIDAIRRDDGIYPVEVNPRYTASVEVLERALGMPAIALHCEACRGALPVFTPAGAGTLQAKACLYAGADLKAPGDLEALYPRGDDTPATADIPGANSVIRNGHPVMTIFAEAMGEEQALAALRQQAELRYGRFTVP